MKTQELRIGNYVFEDYGGIYIVQSIKDNGIISISKTITTISIDYKINELKPIPLTEEYMLKMGFNNIENYLFKNIGSIEIGYFINSKRMFIMIGSSNISIQIKYLHQLQNLYFALTGEELKIK